MKIKVEKWIVGHEVSYKILDIEKCCDKLINSKNISINTEFDEHEDCYNEDKMNYSVKLVRSEYDEEVGDIYYYEKVDFCPWCGKPITIEIVNEVDKTEEYKLLQEQRDALWKKCCKTDSKKKESQLREQVRELDNKINNMLTSDDFEKEVEEN